MPQSVDILKCYQVLDIAPGATVEQVRKSYLELAHVWDPAQHVNNPPLRVIAEQKRKEIDAAYAALSEFLPDLRRGLDAEKAPDPERPADAIDDVVVPVAPPESHTAVIGAIVSVLVGALVFVGWSMWQHLSHVSKSAPAFVVPDDR